MKAPDKIYLSVDKNENWEYAMWTTKSPQEQKFSELDKHEEYIRKDALLEWLEEVASLNLFAIEGVGNDYQHGMNDAYQHVIDKLNNF